MIFNSEKDSTYAEFMLVWRSAIKCWYIGVFVLRKTIFSENFAHVLNGWSRNMSDEYHFCDRWYVLGERTCVKLLKMSINTEGEELEYTPDSHDKEVEISGDVRPQWMKSMQQSVRNWVHILPQVIYIF